MDNGRFSAAAAAGRMKSQECVGGVSTAQKRRRRDADSDRDSDGGSIRVNSVRRVQPAPLSLRLKTSLFISLCPCLPSFARALALFCFHVLCFHSVLCSLLIAQHLRAG